MTIRSCVVITGAGAGASPIGLARQVDRRGLLAYYGFVTIRRVVDMLMSRSWNFRRERVSFPIVSHLRVESLRRPNWRVLLFVLRCLQRTFIRDSTRRQTEKIDS